MIRWTGLAPWESEFSFPGSLTSTFLAILQPNPKIARCATWDVFLRKVEREEFKQDFKMEIALVEQYPDLPEVCPLPVYGLGSKAKARFAHFRARKEELEENTRTFAFKPRPEFGLDCLECFTFSRQRVKREVLDFERSSGSTPIFQRSAYERMWHISDSYCLIMVLAFR